MNTACLGDWGKKICNETNWIFFYSVWSKNVNPIVYFCYNMYVTHMLLQCVCLPLCFVALCLVLPPCIRLSPFHSLVFHQPSTTLSVSFTLHESLCLFLVSFSLFFPFLPIWMMAFYVRQYMWEFLASVCCAQTLQSYSQYIFLIFAPHSSLPTRLPTRSTAGSAIVCNSLRVC